MSTLTEKTPKRDADAVLDVELPSKPARAVLTDDERALATMVNPFEGDFGDLGDRVFLDRIGFARKDGECSFCQQPILPGDQQRRMSAKLDGEMRSYRWCVPCCRSMLDNGDDEDDPGPCPRCDDDGRDPHNDYLLPCPVCQGEQQP